jgi:hypothetical protein
VNAQAKAQPACYHSVWVASPPGVHALAGTTTGTLKA